MCSRIQWPLVVAAWLGLVVAGFWKLTEYQLQGGAVAVVPAVWPENSALLHSRHRWSLLFFAHPQCPCTRASLSELARLMARVSHSTDAHVVFNWPEGMSRQWLEDDLFAVAQHINGVSVWIDSQGHLTHQFGALTSGHVLLFDRQGALRFSGGLTPSRGHEGNSLGKIAIHQLIEGDSSPLTQSAVYGCPLDDPSTAARVTKGPIQ